MKFNRKKLLTNIDAILKNDAEQVAKRQAAIGKWRKENEADFIKHGRELWIQYARDVMDFVDAYQIIRDGYDLPSRPSYYSEYLVEHRKIKERYPALYSGTVEQLKVMKAVLEAVSDEEVSSSDLERMGFNGRALAAIFQESLDPR